MELKTLPLTRTQEGIWLADQVSDDKNLYTISHCVELKGNIQGQQLQQAIRLALGEADTVIAQYENGKQHFIDNSMDDFQVETVDYRKLENGRKNAFAIMQEDTNKDLPLTNERLTALTITVLR